jgi:hypothetical protein
MHKPLYTLNTLFAQLGLDDSDEAIERFINASGPVPESIPLHEAPCWNKAQSDLLREAVSNDADWAEVVDQLDALLRLS